MSLKWGFLAHADEVHGTLSGPATKKVLEREAEVYGHADYARLAGKVGHRPQQYLVDRLTGAKPHAGDTAHG